MSEQRFFWGSLGESARAEEKNHRGTKGTEAEVAPLLRALCASVVQMSCQKHGSVRASKGNSRLRPQGISAVRLANTQWIGTDLEPVSPPSPPRATSTTMCEQGSCRQTEASSKSGSHGPCTDDADDKE